MIEYISISLASRWPYLLLVLVVICHALRNHFNKGLNKYPGPFLASFTNWWRFFSVAGGQAQFTWRQLHEKHGDIVRLGPNALSFGNPAAVKAIYGLSNRLNKSDFYPVQMQISRGQVLQSLFGTLDQDYHARMRRLVSNAFAMSSLVRYEPRVNGTIRAFLEQTDRLFAGPGKACDFVTWLQYFAFDVVMEITYSKRVGFVDNCEDVDGIIAWLGQWFDYAAPVGQVPWLDKFLVKNPIRMWLSKRGFIDDSSATGRFSQARMNERLSDMAKGKEGSAGSTFPSSGEDLLMNFLKAQRENPGFFNDSRVLTMTTSIALAGSDTTAIALSAVFYNLLKNPRCYERLNKEIEDAIANGLIEYKSGIISWTDAQKLTYLDACIKEALRVHPSIGMILERVVPPEGLQICEAFIPGGTIVGCSSWVLHDRPEIFGEDVHVYRPERWLVDPNNASESEVARLRDMNNAMFHFGAGSRTCLGKNIALLEMYKLIPSFLNRFDIKLNQPDIDWKLRIAWFVKPRDFDVLLTTKEPTAVSGEASLA